MDSLSFLAARVGDRLRPTAPPEPIGGGFSGAAVLKVTGRDATFAVRGWPEGVDPRRVRSLHRFLRHISTAGLPVAVPLADPAGETLFEVAGRWWQAEPWLPGRADFRDDPSDIRLIAAVRTLAELHQAASAYRPPRGDTLHGPGFGPAPTVLDRRAIFDRLASGELAAIRRGVEAAPDGEFPRLAVRLLRAFDRSAGCVADDLRLAAGIAVPLTPCLRDVWHDHVLFTGDRVTGIVDPSACRRDTAAADLSRLLGSLLGNDTRRWDVALAEYGRVRPLDEGEAALVPILDRSGVLLSGMTWLRRHYLLGRPCDTPAVMERLRGITARLDAA